MQGCRLGVVVSALALAGTGVPDGAAAQSFTGIGSGARAFQQLDADKLPTPNVYRAATGEPGPRYWQQRADYVIDVAIDEDKKRLTGAETILYTNNSPHTLRYLWVQLDQNRFADGSLARMSETAATSGSRREAGSAQDRLSYGALARQMALADVDHGFKIEAVQDRNGKNLPYTVVDTMMRVDLPSPLAPGQTFELDIDWHQQIIDESVVGGRGGYKCFPVDARPENQDKDCIFFLAQWFPRMAAFTDYEGWHNKAFLGRGEFTLEFGDYVVSITAPADHIVTATGELTNPGEVLTPQQRQRLARAKESDRPVMIVTPEEAKENEQEGTSERQTWRFEAENVRDFAFASSRKFIWDAMGYRQDDDENPVVMAMSFYPNEAEPIWSQYSTEAVVHTMDVYNRFSFNYPYPYAISVNAWERGGMEYPMITFNGYRPNAEDAPNGEVTYTRGIKYGLIGVIIHEIGHIYFPMTVNSDERQWTWMDEGLNTFLEYVAEIEWEENYPAFRGKTNILDYITSYMTSANQVPIMTQSDSILQFGPNAYSKPAAGLTILRETVLGRELFDPAFREYARRWKFKRPTPADFFRTMEEVSGVDLDWFFRGWWYTTDHVDLAVTGMRQYTISSQDPDQEASYQRREASQREPEPLIQRRNREEGRETRLERRGEALEDFYTENDQFVPTNKQRNDYQRFLDELSDADRAIFERAQERQPYVTFVDFENVGGLVMPIPLTLTYEGGDVETMMIPAEIWRRDAERVTKMFLTETPIISVEIDVDHEIADADPTNNAFPQKPVTSRLELYLSQRSSTNQMADALVELEGDDKGETAGEQGPDVPLSAGAGDAPPNDAEAEPTAEGPSESEGDKAEEGGQREEADE
ncbi:Zn-dependent aminopeptidase [Parvularcula bermudensis HTCC2503]|uniref:Zn-dependent aminopeptidase n=1 Tax=Parvularcula bermudensis (strain ATCC BAA-594 / HTCC2503 / KCTC 12087) TaxID=314260 RepID=E0TEN4_PARBH|nr:M1 family metallopeptidase [Parvularcula bermudensis]ADM08917.1 Zn-dependent aminopeptidase [Parvularcula bermudensis HTCC2503]